MAIPRLAILIGALCLAGSRPLSAQPAESRTGDGRNRPPMPLTTDTKEYCLTLFTRFAALQRLVAEPSPDARLLAFEGRQMCEHELILPGIRRVRMAIHILRTRR